MAALNEASDKHGRATERSHHALAVEMCAASALAKFIEEDEGSLEEAGREMAGEIRQTHGKCAAAFDKLDAEIAEPNHFATALPVKDGELAFV